MSHPLFILILVYVGPTERERGVMALEERVAQTCGLLNATTASLVATIAEVLATNAWHGVGIRSAEHWVSWHCGVGSGRARRLVRMARRLGAELPVTKAAFDAGELSEDQVDAVARFVPARNDAEAAELAHNATVSQLTSVLGSYPFQDDDTVPPKPEPARREVNFGHGEDRAWKLRALLEPDEGALLERALVSARDELFAALRGEGDGSEDAPRPELSWADALVRMAERSLDHGAEGPLAERYQVLLHVRADTPAKDAHLHLGPALSRAARRERSCDATVRAVVEDDGVPVALGRRRRTVPSTLRLLVEERDRGCQVHGCSQRRWLVMHHLVHWEDGGLTDLTNVCAVCPVHHRAHHRGALDITGDPTRPGGLVFSDPKTGQVLDACGRPRPPNVSPAEAAGDLGIEHRRYGHPYGERLDRWGVSFREAG